jgi:hypothetical protein
MDQTKSYLDTRLQLVVICIGLIGSPLLAMYSMLVSFILGVYFRWGGWSRIPP